MDEHRGSRGWRAVVVMGVALAGACASMASGSYGVSLDDRGRPAAAAGAPASALMVSAGEIAAVSSPYFGAVEITFENTSAAWVQIDQVTLDFGTPERNHSVVIPWGADLEVWERAVSQRGRITGERQRSFPFVAFEGESGGAPPTFGGALEPAAVPAFSTRSPAGGPQGPEPAPRFPTTHLLALPIRVPPGLFVKRWLLINTAASPLAGCVDSVILGYETNSHLHGRVLLHFKDAVSFSEWQRESCNHRH